MGNKKEVKIPGKTSQITRDPFPASEKIYVNGEIHKDIKVAMRQINLTDSKAMFTKGEFIKEKNEPVVVYDTSGPFTDLVCICPAYLTAHGKNLCL